MNWRWVALLMSVALVDGLKAAEPVIERADEGIVFNGVLIYNVADLEREPDGRYAFRRAGKMVHEAFGKQGRMMNAGNTGVELRFVMVDDEVKLHLGGATEGSVSSITVYHGDIVGDWPELTKTVVGTNVEIVVRKAGNLAALRAEAVRRGDRFDPEVVRLVLPWGAIGIRDVVGKAVPPPKAMVPARTYLAYGSSITHGSNAPVIGESYAALVGHALGTDVRNLGFAGSAAMEGAVADFIAGLKFDFATLEMGINVLGMDPAEYEKRVRYFIRRIAESHPQAKVLAIDVFGFRTGNAGSKAKAEAFRAIVRRVVGELACPNVTYVNGLDLLPDDTDLSSGGVHPSPEGHRRIAAGIIPRLSGHASGRDAR